jgi:hypothetical protein
VLVTEVEAVELDYELWFSQKIMCYFQNFVLEDATNPFKSVKYWLSHHLHVMEWDEEEEDNEQDIGEHCENMNLRFISGCSS